MVAEVLHNQQSVVVQRHTTSTNGHLRSQHHNPILSMSLISYQLRLNPLIPVQPMSMGVLIAQANTWDPGKATGTADPSTCSFAAGNSIVFKVSLAANSNANAYISNIGFSFANK
jgi:hypothetical protein